MPIHRHRLAIVDGLDHDAQDLARALCGFHLERRGTIVRIMQDGDARGSRKHLVRGRADRPARAADRETPSTEQEPKDWARRNPGDRSVPPSPPAAPRAGPPLVSSGAESSKGTIGLQPLRAMTGSEPPEDHAAD